eukprot:486769_1
MSTNQLSTTWISLKEFPVSISSIKIPTGIDRNNYIVINHDFRLNKINCIFKYNIDNDKWIKMDSFNNVENISPFSAALDTKREILFLSHTDSMTQIPLKTNNPITNHTHDKLVADEDNIHDSTTIIVNNSLFVVGGNYNNSILKWDLENKTLTKFSDMYNKRTGDVLGIINSNKHNCVLIFG